MPARLAAHSADPAWSGWLERLPRMVGDLLREWGLTADGSAASGAAALVLPVRTRDGEPAALKVSWPHPEAETEHLALRYWDGDGAVRLLRADPRRFALLLERLDGARDLTTVPIDEAIEIAVGLYPRLHRTPPPQLRTLSSLSAEWSADLARLRSDGRVPRRLVEHAIALTRAFADDPATDGLLIHSDLHYGNVLAALPGADREPWLAIDPKPLSGDPAYEVGSLLANRWDEMPPDRIRDALLGRLWVAVQASGLDEDRVRDWALVRAVVDILWDADDGNLTPERLEPRILLAKAMER